MLNMQNVKELAITEGDVRTIHDKDSRLIWGRLAYDTKYAGDTFQQTYSGKNLFSLFHILSEKIASGSTITMNNGTSYTVTESSISTTASGNDCYLLVDGSTTLEASDFNIPVTGGTDYTLSYDCDGYGQYIIRVYSGDGTQLQQLSNNYLGETGHKTATFTTDASASYLRIRLDNESNRHSGSVCTISNVQLEKSSSETSYEPYVGGIPAPNPDYPQTVNVVTGEQTVTVSDGVDTEAFPITLGSIELCKIGDYQDYIYKSGDDWYVHKEIGKVTLDGTEGWVASSSGNFFSLADITDVIQVPTDQTAPMVSYYYTTTTRDSLYDATVDYGIGCNTNTSRIYIRNKDITTGTNFKNWLSSHNTTVYYALDTPTNTKIIDATLVGQLEAIHAWLTRYGYNATVTGNLPIIIQQTNLT